MKQATKDKLLEAQIYCDVNDKSTGFMIQYMQDFAGVNYDCVMNYLESGIRNGTVKPKKHGN